MVTIRKRPMTKKEASKGEKDIIVVAENHVTIGEEREKVDLTKYTEYHRYKFDRVYDETISNNDVSSLDISIRYLQSSQRCLQRNKIHLFRIWSNRERENFHNDGH